MLLRHSHLNRISANLTAIRFINGGLFNGDNALTSPPDAQHTHFKVFEIDPPSFDIDVRALSQKYKALQTKLHPDKFASAGSDQVRLAEAWSARVNDAYQGLLKPLNRALYLLELHGNPLHEGDIATDANFLAEIMEINEEVVEAETPADLSGISEHNKSILADYVNKVSEAFRTDDVAGARELIAKMKYYSNIQDKIVEREHEMGIVH